MPLPMWKRGQEQLTLSSQPAQCLGPCLAKQRANTCLGPFLPSLFLGAQGQVLLSCPVFSHHHLSRVCSEPQGWPVSQKQTQAWLRMSRCSCPREEEASQVSPTHRARAAHKRSFLKGTESRKRPKSTKIMYYFQLQKTFFLIFYFQVKANFIYLAGRG